MLTLVWGNSFKRAYKKVIISDPELKPKIIRTLETFCENPHRPSLKVHKLSGKLQGLCALVVAYDCRIIFEFLDEQNALLIDIGTHDDVY
jgi:mRNA-degrading endonuclease YafQ of YafQ-DinJ toxin-antitoxin module